MSDTLPLPPSPRAAASAPASAASGDVPAAPASPRGEAEAVEALLAFGDHVGAAERLGTALRRWPGDLKLHFLLAELFVATNRPAAAEAAYRAAIGRFPANPWPALRLVRHLLATGDKAGARAAFAEHVWTAEPHEAALPLLNQLTALPGDAEARQTFLRSLLRSTAADRFVLVKLAVAAFRAHDKREAIRLFDEASALGPLPVEGGALQLDLLIVAGRFAEALSLALDLVSRQPDRVDLVRRAILAAYMANDVPVLVRLLETGLERWPDDWFMVFRYVRSHAPMEVDRRLFARLQERAPTMRDDERWSFQFALACLRHEHTRTALEILDRLSPNGPVAHMSEPLRRAMAARPRDAWTNPRAVSNDPADDVQVFRRSDARATLVVFAGVQGGLGYLPYSHADVFIGAHPVNVVYLRDRNNRNFQTGVARLGADEAATVAALQRLAADLGGLPMITTGASVGGVAATRCGMLAGAAAVVSFAGPVHLDTDADPEEAPVSRTNYRGAMLTALAGNDERLLACIAASTATRLHQCYGTGYPADVATAELLRPLGNVVLEPVEGCNDHFVVEHTLADGSFDRLLQRVVDELGGPRP